MTDRRQVAVVVKDSLRRQPAGTIVLIKHQAFGKLHPNEHHHHVNEPASPKPAPSVQTDCLFLDCRAAGVLTIMQNASSTKRHRDDGDNETRRKKKSVLSLSTVSCVSQRSSSATLLIHYNTYWVVQACTSYCSQGPASCLDHQAKLSAAYQRK